MLFCLFLHKDKDTKNLTPPNNMTCSLSRTMMPPSFNLHLQCQEAILPSWRKLFPHMAELPPEVNHEERRRYRKSTFLHISQEVCPPTWDGASCLPPTLAGHVATLPCMTFFDGVYYSPQCNNNHRKL